VGNGREGAVVDVVAAAVAPCDYSIAGRVFAPTGEHAIGCEESVAFEFGAGGLVESLAGEVIAGDHRHLLDAVLLVRCFPLAGEFEDRVDLGDVDGGPFVCARGRCRGRRRRVLRARTARPGRVGGALGGGMGPPTVWLMAASQPPVRLSSMSSAQIVIAWMPAVSRSSRAARPVGAAPITNQPAFT
jgi:hypothetical protein